MISVDMYTYEGAVKVMTFREADVRSIPVYIKHRKLFLCGVDPSKSGYGVTFRDFNGNPKYSFEVKGGDSTLEEFSNFLFLFWEIVLDTISIQYAGQEKVILAKAHIPMVTLNEVRVVTNQAFAKIGIRVEEINNHSWKHKVLPKELRKQSVKKGSLKHYSDALNYKFKSDNITDSLGVSEYLFYLSNTDMDLMPDAPVTEINALSMLTTYDIGLPRFKINPSMSLQENADWIRTKLNSNMCALVPLSIIPIEEIYKSQVTTNDDFLFDKSITEVYFNVIGG